MKQTIISMRLYLHSWLFFFCKCVITIFLIGKSCRLHALLGINNWYCYNDYHCVGNWFACWLFSTYWTCIHDIQKRKQKWYIYIPLYCFMLWCFLYVFHNFFQSQLCTGENRIFSIRTHINACLHRNDTSMSLWL